MIDLHTADTLAWRALITWAEAEMTVTLAPDVEAYLSRTLIRYLGEPGRLTDRSVAAKFANPFHYRAADVHKLRALGDKSLLLVGLFPEHVTTQPVPLNTLIDLGRYAYRVCATHTNETLFARIDRDFIQMMDVLRTMRDFDCEIRCSDGLGAYQLWHETGSMHAWRALGTVTDGLPVASPSVCSH